MCPRCVPACLPSSVWQCVPDVSQMCLGVSSYDVAYYGMCPDASPCVRLLCPGCVLECALGQVFSPLCSAVFLMSAGGHFSCFDYYALRPALAQASRGRFSLTRPLAWARSPEKLRAARPRSNQDHAASKQLYRLLRHAGVHVSFKSNLLNM